MSATASAHPNQHHQHHLSTYPAQNGSGLPRAIVPSSYVGFDTITRQAEKKLVKRGFHFNLMVVGQAGLGKSTFVNTLFTSHVLDSKGLGTNKTPVDQQQSYSPRQTTEIHTVAYAVEENGIRMDLTLIDTPGFGDQVNNDYCWEPVTRYIKDQFALYLRRELSPTRDRFIADTRVHCVLYFIQPTGHSLKPLDIIVMKKMGEITNVIPVIAKSDSLTPEERTAFKRRVREELKFHGISVFPPDSEDFVDNSDGGVSRALADFSLSDDPSLDESIRSMIPFSVVGSEQTIIGEDGQLVRVRKNRWGLIKVDDPLHCEFIHLRNFIMRTHLQQLIETTALVHYEKFRTRQLLALKEASSGGKSA